ncbi:hypothetical protein BJ998_001541 [Kutzneria kofuensis]|uniref:Uncharacterized protein n=1 Tax=Kutzneria kofuensis TaxID=103725 RepID=A0A7W9NF55_9PSEU|nr:hypothetical protein [Kutzneria kofuensis]MBB5890345.1 hypothetical protein [Kutzneria kofuensis]
MTLYAADGGHRDRHEAEHFALELAPEASLLCTHVVREPVPHHAVSFELNGHSDFEELRDRTGGRAFRFPGQDALRGSLTVREIVASSAIDRVVGVGCTATDDTVVDTRDYVRPVYADGLLTLHVTPAVDGSAVPLEVEGAHVC